MQCEDYLSLLRLSCNLDDDSTSDDEGYDLDAFVRCISLDVGMGRLGEAEEEEKPRACMTRREIVSLDATAESEPHAGAAGASSVAAGATTAAAAASVAVVASKKRRASAPSCAKHAVIKKPKLLKGLEAVADELLAEFATTGRVMSAADIVRGHPCAMPLKTAETVMQIMCRRGKAERAKDGRSIVVY